MDLPQRKNIRISDYDYSQNGYYFATICTHQKKSVLGKIADGVMVLNEWGKIISDAWFDLPNHNKNMQLDYFCVMPNHIHGILIIDNCREGFQTLPQKTTNSISEMIRQLKTFSSRRINEFRKRNGLEPFPTGAFWQKSYYDHIVRDEQELQNIREYIQNNPLKWQDDKYYCE